MLWYLFFGWSLLILPLRPLYLGPTLRNEKYRLMVWENIVGDTAEIELFNNSELPIPHHNIANENPEIVEYLLTKLKNENL